MTSSNLKLILLLTVVFLTVIFARNNSTGSDPRSTLLVTESIVKNHTIKLDSYGDAVLNKYGYAIQEKNGHKYYYFPIGSSILSIPFVIVANTFGMNMEVWEPKLQKIIAAFTSVITTIIFVLLARIFLSENNSLVIGAIFWFGTTLSSTSGTALWSHNFATLFALSAIYISIKSAKQNNFNSWPLIALFLFVSYLCRPTMAILSPLLLVFVFSCSKPKAILTSLLISFMVGLFVIFSYKEFGQPLPDYYMPKRLAGGSFVTALYGNLFSPARGLFVYSPFILMAWTCILISKKDWGLKNTWLLIAFVWPVLHLIMISRFPHWWAGASYGPRLMTDVLPGLFVLTLYTWPTQFVTKHIKYILIPLVIASFFSIFVNSVQGLFNHYTAEWNGDPSIDSYPEYIFDWSYPQFASNSHGHKKRLDDFNNVEYFDFPYEFIKYTDPNNVLKGVKSNEELYFNSKNLIFTGWSYPEELHRWSSGTKASINLLIENNVNFIGEIKTRSSHLGMQRLIVYINGHKVYTGRLRDDFVLKFDPVLLSLGINQIDFVLPDARSPSNGDSRQLALLLRSITLK